MAKAKLSIQYREATVDDVPEIARVEAMVKEDSNGASGERSDRKRLEERWDGYVRRTRFPREAEEPRVLYAAFAGAEMVGFIAGHFSHRFGTQGELQSIHVRKDYQGRGIGANLLKRLASWFVAADRRRICICIAPENPYRRFYEKHGAGYINPHWMVWEDIGRVVDEEG